MTAPLGGDQSDIAQAKAKWSKENVPPENSIPVESHPVLISGATHDAHALSLSFLLICRSLLGVCQPLATAIYFCSMSRNHGFDAGGEAIKKYDRCQGKFLGANELPFHALQHFHRLPDLLCIVLRGTKRQTETYKQILEKWDVRMVHGET